MPSSQRSRPAHATVRRRRSRPLRETAIRVGTVVGSLLSVAVLATVVVSPSAPADPAAGRAGSHVVAEGTATAAGPRG